VDIFKEQWSITRQAVPLMILAVGLNLVFWGGLIVVAIWAVKHFILP